MIDLTAQEMKVAVGRFLKRKKYIGVFTEVINGADLFGIKKNMQTVEVEIKVTRRDLMKEIKAINSIKKYYVSDLKITKHACYLGKKDFTVVQDPNMIVPNRFYLAVPENLKAPAIKATRFLPYGVITYRKGYTKSVTIVKKSEKLHGKAQPQSLLIRLIRRVSTENLNLRERVYLK